MFSDIQNNNIWEQLKLESFKDFKDIQLYNTEESLKKIVDNKNIKNEILKDYPKLKIIKENLTIDWYSKFENMKHHFDDLNLLPNSVLQKISNMTPIPYICITDRPPVTAWGLGFTWTPKWYPSDATWSNVEWFLYNWNIYIWRALNQYWTDYALLNGSAHTILHEIWHLFDEKNLYSQSTKFKDFHKKFYNKLDSYFQQWWPGWPKWCSEFFAECSSLFFYWKKSVFVSMYNKEFYDYMAECLL